MVTDTPQIPESSPNRDYVWLVRNASRVGLTNVALVILGVAQSVLLARLLGPRGKGEVFLAVLTASVVAQLVSLSSGASIQYYVGRGELSLQRAWGVIVVYISAVALFVSLGLLIYFRFSSGLPLNASYPVYTLVLLAVFMIGETFNELVLPFFVASDLVKWRTAAEIGQRAVMVTFATILILIAHRGVTGALEAYVIGGVATQAVTIIALSARLGVELPRRSDHIRVLGFGMRQHGGAVTARMLKRLDSYVLFYFMGPAAVGVYSVASALAELLLLIPRAISATLVSYVSSNPLAAAIEGTRHVMKRGAALLASGALLFGVLGTVLLPIVYGNAFRDARAPFALLCCATAFLGIYVIVGAFVVGSGRPHVTSLIMAASAALNVALSFALIPSFGLVGNATATLVTSACAAALVVRHVSSGKVAGHASYSFGGSQP